MIYQINIRGMLSALILTLISATSLLATIEITTITHSEIGQCSGELEITAEGTANPFSLELVGPGNRIAEGVNGVIIFTDLCPGDYYLSVSSEYGCVIDFTVHIDGGFTISPANWPVVDLTHPSSCILDDGSIEFSNGVLHPLVNGGTSPFTWTWSNGQSGNGLYNIYNLSAGTYGLTITDAYGYPTVFDDAYDLVLNAPGSYNATASASNTTPDNCDGTIDVQFDSQAPPFNITLSGGGSTTTLQGNATNQNFTGLCAGDYTITILDANDCEEVLEVMIASCGDITIAEPGLIFPSKCGALGAIKFGQSLPTGGVEPYQYLWSNGATTLSVSDLDVGTHSLTITDAFGCTEELSYIIDIGNDDEPWNTQFDLEFNRRGSSNV